MLRCSHILCKVDNIHDAASRWRALGFDVQLGGAERRAHNALVWFEQGPFIELFELPRAARFLRWPLTLAYGAAMGARFARWAESPVGFCDVALEPSLAPEIDRTDLRAVRAALRGSDLSRVWNGRRTRPDGQRVRYRVLAPAPASLPFIVSHYDPPQRPQRLKHPNGARGVAWVRMSVATSERAAFQSLAPDDRWLRSEPGARTEVVEVALLGLRGTICAVETSLHAAGVQEAR